MRELKVFVLGTLCAVAMTLFIHALSYVIFDYTPSNTMTFGMGFGFGIYYSALFRRNLK